MPTGKPPSASAAPNSRSSYETTASISGDATGSRSDLRLSETRLPRELFSTRVHRHSRVVNPSGSSFILCSGSVSAAQIRRIEKPDNYGMARLPGPIALLQRRRLCLPTNFLRLTGLANEKRPLHSIFVRFDHVRPSDSVTKILHFFWILSDARFADSSTRSRVISPLRLYSAVGRRYVMPSFEVMVRLNPSASIAA